ncbi:alpha/beta hydrolase-fold protein [Actinoplanes rectilineatus]|uniref:alpha/beta hydrolase-fold protein n=1 Tax=Actinoplanes rectilineatus TaxID=113571 RepID=UPI001FE1C06E|nr:alpha/beta hydrolase-fold protein [Actinoplanes rectilineatus]
MLSTLMADPNPAAVDRFWSAATAAGTPLVEPRDDGNVLVTFLWRGEARSTRAWWNIDVPLSRLPGTDLWVGSHVFPADLRTIYYFRHHGTETMPSGPGGAGPTHIDVANPRRLHMPADPLDPADHDCWASLLELPQAPVQPWSGVLPGVGRGELTTAMLASAALGGEHPITVYRPAGVPAADLPVLVVFDGHLGQALLKAPTVLDNLIAAGRIPPVAALFVHTFTDRRDRDLTPGDPIEAFVTAELLPWARARFGVGSPAGHNLVTGVSRGGLVATYLGLRRPDLFTAVIAQSGSFWWPSPAEGDPCRLIRDVPRMPPGDVDFYLDVGDHETIPGPGGAPSQLTVGRGMRDALRAAGRPVTYREYSGGHDYASWRGTFPAGLTACLGR